MDFLNKVGTFIAANGLLCNGDRVIVGVSGGADSTALLLVLRSLGYECVAIHCNFHLRGEESNRDQIFVENFCGELQIALKVIHFDTVEYADRHRCSIEMAARELRYDAFEKYRNECNCAAIAVAHHRDDSVETVLLNLVRGTGIRGLTGIKPRNGNVVRPMLCVSRQEIESWLKMQERTYVMDSTNLECEYKRNKIRLRVLPELRGLNPDADNAVFRTSMRLRGVLDIYLAAIENDMRRCVSRQPDGIVRVSINAMRESVSPEAVLFELLSPYGFTESQIENVISCLDGESGRIFRAGNAILVKDRDSLLVNPLCGDDGILEMRITVSDGLCIPLPDGGNLRMALQTVPVPLIRDTTIAMLDADKVGRNIIIRRCRQGDSFIPFGMKGRKLVSDFMTDNKMSVLQKRDQIVLCNDSGIVWVVGRRIDNRYRVDEKTSNILIINMENKESGQ